MKPTYLLFILFFAFLSNGKLKAQDNEQIAAFISKVETYVKKSFEKTSNLVHTAQIIKTRRSKTIAINKILGQEFIRKTVYNRHGLKKDILQIWYGDSNDRMKIAEIISINDEYFKIRFSTFYTTGKILTKKSLEEFTAGSSYKKTNYDRKGKVINTIEILSWE